jgi:glyceraldehyde 3-phosphate dehydrogenase
MAKVRVAFNGMGRIGKNVMRVIVSQYNDQIEIVAGNDLVSPAEIAAAIPKDSIHGKFPVDVKLVSDNVIQIGDHKVTVYAEKDANQIPWGKHNVDVVLECTGFYLTTEKAQAHINAGAKKVIVSAPCKDDTKTVVIGVNHKTLTADDKIISNASCTTNCLAPVCKVLDDTFGIENGLMTTVHSYTNDQNLLDVKHKKDFRRARAAAINMIPTSTGAAKAIGLVMPHLKGQLNGFAIRVPTADVSVVDLTVNLKKEVTVEAINAAFDKAGAELGKMILVDHDKRVSGDFIGCDYSAIFVPDLTRVVGSNTAKVVAWYDNEWGYSCRLVDMMHFVATH